MSQNEQKKSLKFGFKRRRTKLMAKELALLEKRFDKELNNITLPCGVKVKLASSISRYEKVRLMMEIKEFASQIPVTNCEYAARMINAWELGVSG